VPRHQFPQVIPCNAQLVGYGLLLLIVQGVEVIACCHHGFVLLFGVFAIMVKWHSLCNFLTKLAEFPFLSRVVPCCYPSFGYTIY
jgi:hypothetical protein